MGNYTIIDLSFLFLNQLIQAIPQLIALVLALNIVHYFFFGRD